MQDSEGFCRETLAHPALVAHVAENYVAWGGNVRFSDAYRVRPVVPWHILCRLERSHDAESMAARRCS